MEREIDRRIGAASAVMWTLHRSVVVKRELSRKAKLWIYQSVLVPTLTSGHELWVVTERTRSRVQAAEMSFLRRLAGLSLRDRVRSSVIRRELGVDPLLLCVERSQMRRLGHLIRMPPGRPPVGDPEEDPGHAGETMSLGWNDLEARMRTITDLNEKVVRHKAHVLKLLYFCVSCYLLYLWLWPIASCQHRKGPGEAKELLRSTQKEALQNSRN